MTKAEFSDLDVLPENTQEQIKREVSNFHYNRGRFLHSYGQTEFLALDIISKFKSVVPYNKIISNFPYSAGTRIKYLRQMISQTGSLEDHQTALSQIASLLENYQEIRHYLAHGFSKVLYTASGEVGIEMRRYDPTLDPDLLWKPTIIKFIPARSFDDMTSNLTNESGFLLRLIREMYGELSLEGPNI